MRKDQDKRELINKFVKNAKKDDLTDKLATVKAVRKFDKDRFENAFNKLRLKTQSTLFKLINNNFFSNPLLRVNKFMRGEENGGR